MQKKIEILNRIKPVSEIKLRTKSGRVFSFYISAEATKQLGIHFLDRIMTPRGELATVIGVHNGQIWYWVDEDSGVTHWDDIHTNLLNPEIGFSKSEDTNYPEAVKKTLSQALGFAIPFEELNLSVDLFMLLKQLDEHKHPPEFLVNLLKRALKLYPDKMNKQLELLIQEFETLSVLDLESVVELTDSVQTQKLQLDNFIKDTKINGATKEQANTISTMVGNLQTQIETLEEQLKQAQQESQPLLCNKLCALKLSLEESRNNLLKSVEALNTVASEVTYLKKISPYKSFHTLISALIETYSEFPINQNAPSDLEHYLAGAAKITRFLYDHGHHFFDEKAEPISNNNNKQEQSESLSQLELMYLFLLLSGGAAMSKTLQARVYFKIFDALNDLLKIEPNNDENMPETFNLFHFVANKPDDFIKLYRYFFVNEGPCRQKAKELIVKEHPVFLAELGKLTYYYATALNAKAKQPDAKPGAQQEANYYFKQGINYLVQSLKQGTPQAIEAFDTLLATKDDKEQQIEGIGEIAKELIAYFTHTKNFVKAHHYLKIALESQDKGSKELQKVLHLLQVKLTLVETSGDEQKAALAILMQEVKEGDRSALALLEELSTQVPAVAFAAVVYWHDEDITKLSLTLLEVAAKENPDLVAWYQNRYRVVCQAQEPELVLILKAIKVGFVPAIVELNELLTTTPDFAKENKTTLLSIISDFDVLQYIYPKIFMALLVNYYIQKDLSKEALNKFIESLAHTSFKQPESHFELLFLVLRDLRTLIGSEELIAVFHTIKRIGLLSSEHHDLLKTIATLLIEREASEDKLMFHFFAQEYLSNYSLLAQALYKDAKAWAILKNNDQIASLIKRVIEDKNHLKGKSPLSELSLFNEQNNKEELANSSKKEKKFSIKADSKGCCLCQ
ncbi:hypothetical protein [Legionella steigerwaltii]|uniref:hypothetical protein n=1 Tax=Legionella steigerwaltii TaxID=460 RepID=UPI001055AB6D|nr:hypothetical protein [Legionella steigerwaltii]